MQLNDKFEYIKSHTELKNFKGKTKIGRMWLEHGIASYNPIFKNITLNRIFVDPYYLLLKYNSACSNGINIVFRHELGHVLTFRNHWLRSRLFSRETEAAAELYAIQERGLYDLIDSFAISIVSHKIAKNLDPKEASKEPNIKKMVQNYFKYFSINRWSQEKFISGISKIYPEAKEIVGKLGQIKEDNIVESIQPKVKEILEKLK